MPGNKKVSAPKKKVAKNAPSKVETPPKVEAPANVETVVDAPVENTVENYSDEFSHLVDQLKVLQNSLKELTLYTSTSLTNQYF